MTQERRSRHDYARVYPGGTLKIPEYFTSRILCRFKSEAEMTELLADYEKNRTTVVYKSVKPSDEDATIAAYAVENGVKAAENEFKLKKFQVYSTIQRVAMWNFRHPDDMVGTPKQA